MSVIQLASCFDGAGVLDYGQECGAPDGASRRGGHVEGETIAKLSEDCGAREEEAEVEADCWTWHGAQADNGDGKGGADYEFDFDEGDYYGYVDLEELELRGRSITPVGLINRHFRDKEM